MGCNCCSIHKAPHCVRRRAGVACLRGPHRGGTPLGMGDGRRAGGCAMQGERLTAAVEAGSADPEQIREAAAVLSRCVAAAAAAAARPPARPSPLPARAANEDRNTET